MTTMTYPSKHKMSFLEDPLETKEDIDMMLKILGNYWPESSAKGSSEL